MVDAGPPDGSRVNAVIPPLALDGAALRIRRFAGRALTGEDPGGPREDRPAQARAARPCRARTSQPAHHRRHRQGKTTTLAALTAFVPRAERLATIEDAAELRIPLPHVVRLESRPASLGGAGGLHPPPW
jgi:pilus assembly protein CpaF